MKTMKSLKKSYNARLNQLRSEIVFLETRIDLINDSESSASEFADMRLSANQIMQCVHEISAYHNAIHTE